MIFRLFENISFGTAYAFYSNSHQNIDRHTWNKKKTYYFYANKCYIYYSFFWWNESINLSLYFTVQIQMSSSYCLFMESKIIYMSKGRNRFWQSQNLTLYASPFSAITCSYPNLFIIVTKNRQYDFNSIAILHLRVCTHIYIHISSCMAYIRMCISWAPLISSAW